MSSHTKGPWITELHEHYDGWVVATDGLVPIAKVPTAYDNHEANAQRIVACVNACEGINPEAVPEMLAALKGIMKLIEDKVLVRDISQDHNTLQFIQNGLALVEPLRRAVDAIAKAEGKQDA